MRDTRFNFLLLAALFMLIAIFAVGCGRAESNARQPDASRHELRIVSLSPAISRTLIDFDLDHYIVGRTPFCDNIDPSITVVGDLLNVDMERLVRLRPTHLLIQPPASGINPALLQLAIDRGWTLGAWHLDTIDDVRTLIRELPDVLGHDPPQATDDLHTRAIELLSRIDTALEPAHNTFTGSILLIANVEPSTVFGHGTYLDEILTALGGRNAATHRGYPQLSLEDVARIKPEAMILIAPGASDQQSTRERLGPLARLDVPAVHQRNLAILRHPDGFLPSTGIIHVADALKEILRDMQAGEP
jgi:iron complex transport system substrate-binding protein